MRSNEEQTLPFLLAACSSTEAEDQAFVPSPPKVEGQEQGPTRLTVTDLGDHSGFGRTVGQATRQPACLGSQREMQLHRLQDLQWLNGQLFATSLATLPDDLNGFFFFFPSN